MTIDLWKQIIPNILKEDKPLEFENINKEYNPWLVNSACSYYMDTILFANEMNRNPHLDKQLQYDFLFYGIKKKKRSYSPWIKKEKESEYIDAIKELHSVSTKKAKEMLPIFNKEQLKDLLKRTEKGGK